MSRDIDIEILSSFNASGFEAALRSIGKLADELKNINQGFVKATGTKGDGVAANIKKSTNALKDLDKETKSSTKSVKEETTRIAGMGVAMAQAAKTGNLLVNNISKREAASKRLATVEKQLAAAEKSRSTAQKEYNTLIASGNASARQKSDASTKLANAVKLETAATRELKNVQKDLTTGSEALVKANTQLIDLQTILNRSMANGAKAPLALKKVIGDLEDQMLEYMFTVDKTSKAEQNAARIAKQSSNIRNNIAKTVGMKSDLTDSVRTSTTARSADLRQTKADAALKAKLEREELRNTIWADNAIRKIGEDTARAMAKTAAVEQRAVAKTAQTAVQAAQKIVQAFSKVIVAALKLAQTLATNLVKGAMSASNALGRLSSSAGARFAALRSSLDMTGKSALSFGRNFGTGMGAANDSIVKTAAGWSLLMAGYTIRGGGMSILKGGGLNISDYLAYEKAASRAAIATGASGNTPQQSFDMVQKLVFGMQRGSIDGQSTGNKVYNLSSEDMAQGAYYYGSALGQEFTNANLPDIARTLAPLLQTAAFTGTTPESVIKGVLNAAQEFGVNPRDTNSDGSLANAGFIQKTNEMFGFLANASSMEVPDIIEFFKMVGPMARIAVGGDAMEAITQVMGFSYMASEYGLRGSRVGSGLSKMLSSIYDPTVKMEGISQNLWGKDVASVFLNEDKTLKGGIMGLIEPFLQLDDSQWLSAAAGLFTENATRNLIPLISQMRDDPTKYADIKGKLESENVGDLLNNASLAGMNTLSGSIQNLKNMWMQFVAAVIDSVKGDLISGMELLGNVIAEIADVIANNPWIGTFFATLMASIGVVMTVVGSFLTFAGTLLILQRAFMFTHGAGTLVFSLLAAIPHLLLVGIPLILAIAAAVALLTRAWEANVFGINDFFTSLRFNDLSTMIQPAITNIQLFGLALNSVFSDLVNAQFDRFIAYLRTFKDEFNGAKSAASEFMSVLASGSGVTIIDNLQKAFDSINFTKVGEFIRSLATGFGTGFAATVLAVGRGLELITAQLSKMGKAGTWLAQQIEQWTGFKLVVSDIGQTIGAIFGAAFAAKLLMSFGPLAGLIGLLQTVAATGLHVGLALGQAVLQIVILAARIVLMTAAYVGYLAVQSAVIGIQAISTAFTLADAVAKAQAAVAAAVLAGATAGMGVAFLAALAPIAGVVSWLLILIGVSLIVVAALIGIIAVGVLIVGFTQGWSQAWADLVQIMQNAWTVLGFVLEGLLTIGLAIAIAVGALLTFIGVTNNWTVIGYALGAALSLVVLGVVALGVAILWSLIAPVMSAILAFAMLAASILLPLMPAILVVGAILLIADALLGLMGYDSVFTYLAKGFDYVADAAGKVVDKVMNLANEMTSLNATAASTVARELSASRQRGWDVGLSPDEKYAAADSYWQSKYGISLQDQIIQDGEQTDSTGNKYYDLHSAQAERGAKAKYNSDWNIANGGYKTVSTPLTGAMAGTSFTRTLDPIQYAEWEANQARSQMDRTSTSSSSSGTFDGGGIVDGSWIDRIKTEYAKLTTKFTSATGVGIGTPSVAGVDQQSMWDKAITSMKDQIPDAVWDDYWSRRKTQESLTSASSAPIIGGRLTPGAVTPNYSLGDSFLPEDGTDPVDASVEEAKAAALKIVEDTVAFNQSITDTLKAGFDLPKAMAMKFDYGKAVGNNSYMGAGTAMAFYGEQIAANIPESADWSNINEGIMDVVGMGGTDLGNMYGQNMHTALKESTGFQNWAAEMGMSVDDMLKGVPKFVHAEEYVPLAFAEIADVVAKYTGGDAAKYSQLDLLGTDIGKKGLDWTELSQFAVSEAQAGNLDWNLADYISESWDMSIDEANAYIKDHGLDPEVINGALLPDLQLSIDSAGGKVNIMTPEWYSWLMDETNGGMSQFISLTQAELDNIPEPIRFTLSSMGFVFVIDPNDATVQSEGVQAAIDQAYANYLAGLGYGPEDGVNPHYNARDGAPVSQSGMTFDEWYVPPSPGLGAGGVMPGSTPVPPGLPPVSDYTAYGTTANAAFISGFEGTGETIDKIDPATLLDLADFVKLGTDAKTSFMQGFSAIASAAPATGGSSPITNPYSFANSASGVSAPTSGGSQVISVSMNKTAFDASMAMVNSALSLLSVRAVYPMISIMDNASWVIASIQNGLNNLPTTKTITINTVSSGGGGTPLPGLASGGYVTSPFTMVGEDGPELLVGNQGSFVHNANETSSLLRSLERNTSSSSSASSTDGSLTVHFHGDNHFNSEADVDKLVNRMSYLLGKQNRAASRGMVPVDISTLHHT